MKTKSMILCSAAAASLALSVMPASAATIVLTDKGGVTGSPAEQGFKIAAAYWGSVLANNVTINLDVKFAALAANVIGSTGSRSRDINISRWEQLVNATKSGSAIDTGIVLPTLNGAGGATMVVNGTTGVNNDTAIGAQVLNAGTTTSTKVLWENTSVLKAIGEIVPSSNLADGSVTFSSNFAFDFNPLDGISAGTMDFIGVAIHEIGHALGFVSGVDAFDYYGYPNGPGAGALGYDLNSTSIFSALDMFRYSNDPNGKNPAPGATLDGTVGTASYFSIDGGLTALYGNSFSTGAYNGDGRQASHWKDASGANRCGPQIGIMDPTFCYGQMGEITGLDLAAFDAIGWNLTTAASQSYSITSAQIYASAVPEPATWTMMIGGFGLAGAMIRRRKAVAKTAIA